MSNTSKGNKIEVMAETILGLRGYAVQRAWRKMIRIGPNRYVSNTNDFFGAFDIIAINSEHVKLVQTTTADGRFERQHKIEAAKIPHNFSVLREVWAWHGGGKRLDKCRTVHKRYVPYQVFYVWRQSTNGWGLAYLLDRDGTIVTESDFDVPVKG